MGIAVQYVVSLLFALCLTLCYTIITRFMFSLLVCFFSLFNVLFLFCVFCVFVLFCVLFLLMHIVIPFLSVQKFTDHCHQVES
jgi:hypothetical protein